MEHGVLFISPHQADAGTLTRMLDPVALQLDHVCSLEEAGTRLREGGYGAVLTEAQLPDGTWTDVLNRIYDWGLSPAVIVTHRLADDRLWAEVLNLGGYDLLAQPFDACEVQRILLNACCSSARKPVQSETASRKLAASG